MIVIMLADYVDDVALIDRVRPDHRVYANQLRQAGKLLAGGPLGGDRSALFLYSVASRDEADRLIDEDPYSREGVLAHKRIQQWLVAGVREDAAEILAAATHTHHQGS